MSAVKLSPKQWSRVLEFLRSQTDLYVGQEAESKRFIEAVGVDERGRVRSGGFCRLSMGNGTASISDSRDGVIVGLWDRMHQHFIDEPDMEYLIIDSAIVRAHACAGGASKKRVDNSRRRWAEAEAGSAQRFT